MTLNFGAKIFFWVKSFHFAKYLIKVSLNFPAKNIEWAISWIIISIWIFAPKQKWSKLDRFSNCRQLLCFFKSNCSIFIQIVLKETVLCHFQKMIINYMKIGSLRRFWQVFKEEDLAEKKKEMWSSRFSFATLLYYEVLYYFGWKMEEAFKRWNQFPKHWTQIV